MRDEDAVGGLLGEPVAGRSVSPMPPYHQRSATLRPYQPGGHTRSAVDPLALDAVAAEHDVAGHERAVAAQGVGGLADRVAERNGRRAVRDDAVSAA